MDYINSPQTITYSFEASKTKRAKLIFRASIFCNYDNMASLYINNNLMTNPNADCSSFENHTYLVEPADSSLHANVHVRDSDDHWYQTSSNMIVTLYYK